MQDTLTWILLFDLPILFRTFHVKSMSTPQIYIIQSLSAPHRCPTSTRPHLNPSGNPTQTNPAQPSPGTPSSPSNKLSYCENKYIYSPQPDHRTTFSNSKPCTKASNRRQKNEKAWEEKGQRNDNGKV